jgi:hypothetical protein
MPLISKGYPRHKTKGLYERASFGKDDMLNNEISTAAGAILRLFYALV